MNRFRRWIERRRTVLLGLGSTLVLFIFLIFLMDWIVMPFYTQHGAEDELPDATELSFEEARRILRSKGFRIFIDGEKYDATYPESTVVFQNPPPYSRVKKGRRIYVTLSAGERRVQVPKVVGLSERDAAFILKQAGLLAGEVFYESSNYYPRGVVCGQSVSEGTEIVEQTAVDITLSIGRLPDRFVVPDVVGKSLETARKLILQAGLQVGSISYEVQKRFIPETVIEQSVQPGEEVHQSTPVDLVVSQLEEEFWEE